MSFILTNPLKCARLALSSSYILKQTSRFKMSVWCQQRMFHLHEQMKNGDKIEVNPSLSDSTQDPLATEMKERTFSCMLRNSKLFQIGDFEGKVVQGVIKKIVGEDLYIDFGGKFYCVCSKPSTAKNPKFIRGQKVRISILDLELSSRFLGANRDLTLCEADGHLIGLLKE